MASARDKMLMDEARTLTRLQAKRRSLRTQLRTVNKDIQTTRKHITALTREDHSNIAWNEHAPPSRVFGEE